MAYVKPIRNPRCVICRKPATAEVMNRVNASLGEFCKPHAGAELKRACAREAGSP